MSRERMTWNEGTTEVPVDDKQAAEAPATPGEGPASPAYKEDPAQDAYAKGDTSSWAEDPNPPPYDNGEAPAVPSEKQAADILERKAAKCIRLATAMLGGEASVEAIEDQALAFMDMEDSAIGSSLSRLAEDEEKKEEDEKGAEAEAAKTIQEDKEHAAEAKKADDSADEAIDDDDAKAAEADLAKESSEKTGYEDRLANIENALRSLVPDAFPTKEADFEPGHVTDEGWDPGATAPAMDEDEAMLEVMLAEEGMSHDPEAMLEAMLAEAEAEAFTTDGTMSADPGEGEGMDQNDPASFGAGPGSESDGNEGMSNVDMAGAMGDDLLVEDVAVADPEVVMVEDMVADPMGVMARELDAKDSEMLAVLFGKDAAEDKAEKEDHDEGAVKDDEEHIADLEEDKDEDEKALKKEEKKAAQNPQPKKASTGAKRLGGVSKEAASEVSNLSSLWESAPDVSRFFN